MANQKIEIYIPNLGKQRDHKKALGDSQQRYDGLDSRKPGVIVY